jgi:hypothetical protein
MRTRCGRLLLIGLVLGGLLAGCTSVPRQDFVSLPNAESPEYITHPFRLLAFPTYLAGNMVQLVSEPLIYLPMNAAPDAFGLSLEEQLYLTQRGELWKRALGGPGYKPLP